MLTNLEFSKNLRKLCLEMVHKAAASHIGSALSIADIVTVLYNEVMNFPNNDVKAEERDRFLLSKGHACSAVYAALHLKGFLKADELKTFAEDFSPLMSHISHKVTGVEFSTGSLGHAMSFGVGKALYAKLKQKKYRTFVLLSDGELNEGSNWEAFMFAAHHKLNNLVAIIDFNNLQSLGTTEETLKLEPLADKFRAFGWVVNEVDGHNHTALSAALTSGCSLKKPNLVICRTVKGKGISFMENKVEWHYKSPSANELKAAIQELQI